MANVLIIDDDKMLCESMARKLESLDHKATCAFTLEEGLEEASAGLYDVVFLDVWLPDGNGLDILPRIQAARSSPEVIIMTGSGSPDGADLAIRSGAWDYMEKPISLNAMVLPLVRALQYREALKESRPTVSLKREGIVGSSLAMKACLDQVAQAASTDTNVLITGETGTGKELLALAIHNNSSRRDKHFVVVDCASLTETLVESMLFGHEKGAYTGADRASSGLIKQADEGTLFLDEVGELPFSIQKSFLRVLQERRFRPLGRKEEVKSNFRLVAATNRNLDQMAEDGHFRNDLLYRLRSLTIDVPPLRNRREDIGELVMHYNNELCKRYKMKVKSISPDFLEVLQQYDWPGNVRELILTIDRAVATAQNGPTLFRKHLPMNVRVKIARDSAGKCPAVKEISSKSMLSDIPKLEVIREEAVAKAEKEYLKNLLLKTNYDMKHVCDISGLRRSRIYNLIKKYGINKSL